MADPPENEKAALNLELTVPVAFRRIPADGEEIERERFEAYLRTRVLMIQQPQRAASRADQDPTDEEILDRLQHIEAKLDDLISRLLAPEDPAGSLAEHWVVLAERGMQLKFEASEHVVLSVGDLVHVTVHLPADHGRLQLLARVRRLGRLDSGLIVVELTYESIGERDQDLILSLAFQAQRLGRRAQT